MNQGLDTGDNGTLCPLNTLLSRIYSRQAETIGNCLKTTLAQQSVEPDCLHDLRVGSRRIAAILRVFAGVISDKPAKQLKKKLKKLRHGTGETRDLDVLLDFLRTLPDTMSRRHRPGVNLFIANCEARRSAQAAATITQLEQLAPALNQAVAEFGKSLWTIPASKTLGELAMEEVVPAVKKFIRRGNRLIQQPECWHEFRIAGKHCRYRLEIFGPLLGDAFRESLYPDFKELQDLLGEIQDIAVGEEILAAFQNVWKQRCSMSGGVGRQARKEALSGLVFVKTAFQNRYDAATAKIGEFWPAIANSNLPEHLERLIQHALKPSQPLEHNLNGPVSERNGLQ